MGVEKDAAEVARGALEKLDHLSPSLCFGDGGALAFCD